MVVSDGAATGSRRLPVRTPSMPGSYRLLMPGQGSQQGLPDPPGRSPRNRRSRTSSDPEGSSDKWRRLCRAPLPVAGVPGALSGTLGV